jgi:uncharacterized protein (TIGR02246 family)
MAFERPIEVVMAFIGRINAHDVDGLCRLMSPDHVFVDAQGSRWQGVEAMRAAWTGYFQWFPDYRISHEQFLQNGNLVAVFGTASASSAVRESSAQANGWQAPAAWMAVVRDGLVAEWRVYADNEGARRLLGGPKE